MASWIVAGVLLIFTARRWLFIFGALISARPKPKPVDPKPAIPPVLLLTPLRNEAQTLPDLLLTLAALDYPTDKLTIVLINDGSTDSSELLIKNWLRGRDNWHILSLGQNVGKAQALNLALDAFPHGEIVAIYDADERPLPTALQTLISPFADKKIGGVSGRRAVGNPLSSPAASYTTFEGLVHQFVTLRAKDRLNLAPAILGANCAYRRSALTEVGNFKPGALLEDSDLTLKLARAGWKIHFEPEAVSYHRVPQTISGYWRQHARWARGFNEVAKNQARSTLLDRQLSLPLRLELLAFSLGYLDRLALLAGAGLVLFNRKSRLLLNLSQELAGRASPPSQPDVGATSTKLSDRLLVGVVVASLLTPLCQIMTALVITRQPLAMWLRMVWVPFFFGLDVAMATAGLWETLKQSPQIWEERRVRK